MPQLRLIALGTVVHRRSRDRVVRTTLVALRSGRSSLRDGHGCSPSDSPLSARRSAIDLETSQDGETREVIASYLSSGSQTHAASVDLSEQETRSGSGEIRLTSLD